jgi:hypothetical protein
MTPRKLPNANSPDLLKIQRVEMESIGVPASPRVRILNSNSDWFHVPGFAAKGAYAGYAGAEVSELLKTVGFDYGSEAARYFEQSVSNSGLPLARADVSVSSESRGWPLSKCSQAVEVDACVDIRLTYFGYVAAFDSSDYVATAHVSARVIRARDGKLLFERNIHYNPIDPGTAIDLFASNEFRFQDLDAMRADPQGVVAGLRAALNALATELEAQLRIATESRPTSE